MQISCDDFFHGKSVIEDYSYWSLSFKEALELQLDSQQIQWLESKHAIRKLEKRFVLRGDLAVRGEPLMDNLTAKQVLIVGAFLLNALSDEYREKQDLNSLNSAVRLTDYLLSFPLEHFKNMSPLKSVLCELLISLEALSNE